jgi:hypothetical protein
VIVCRPADPEAKGLVERAHDYLERSFLPGRSFTGPGDFNGQLQRWLTVVNGRTRRALGCAPATPREEIENEVPAGFGYCQRSAGYRSRLRRPLGA